MLNEEQVAEAIRQMIIQCDLAYDDHYRMVSARSVLRELGYEEHTTQVLEHIASRGFDYCLDREIKSNGPDGEREYPDANVCFWGPDQLKSRLQSLRTWEV